MKAIGEAAGGSVNDVLLAACGAALRRYLAEYDALPKESLVASVPVALPRDPGEAGGNAVSFANVRLGTDIADVRKRFAAIHASSVAGRAHVMRMQGPALMTYTVLISTPLLITRLPGVGARLPPIYNVIISNVPGPREALYFLGARMDGYYPISALAHGQALNITVMSYAGGLYCGVTACPDRVPSMQRVAVYLGEAIDELERVFVKTRRTPKKKHATVSKRSGRTHRRPSATKPAAARRRAPSKRS
jgi:diacylglycerol O-acyltransferase